jgi:adenine phosphoribosyltransferase
VIDLEQFIRNIPDFPKPGIQFKDITPLLSSELAFKTAILKMSEPFKNLNITKVVGIEARGFLFAAPVAIELGVGVVPIRKPGKLPYLTESYTYSLEYGTDTIQIHKDAVNSQDRVLLVDDVLATGGTIRAACNLIEKLSAQVAGISFLSELGFLHGREKIVSYNVQSLIIF